jgi:hypothetical protein
MLTTEVTGMQISSYMGIMQEFFDIDTVNINQLHSSPPVFYKKSLLFSLSGETRHEIHK